MAFTKESLLIPPGRGEPIHSMLVKIRAVELGGDFSIMEGRIDPHQLLVPHVHEHEDQAVFIIEGALEFEVGGENGEHFTAEAGAYVIKPRRISHGFWNIHDVPCRYIELSGRSNFEQFVDTTRDSALRGASKSESEFDLKFLYSHIPRLMKTHKLTSIVGIEGLELPKLPELPKLRELLGR